ncbi:MAG TPA: hypothetical protein VMY76_09190 [Gemmatimonadales bacterium]|nr:hypothetical protein [Gemmatimonadales bacterium]
MRRAQIAVALVAAAGVALAACGESSDPLPTSPQFKPTPPPSFSCDFDAARGFARGYFGQPTQNVIVGKFDFMESTGDPQRTAAGLDIFHAVAVGVDVVGTAAQGSNLLNSTAACSSLGATALIDWTLALGPQGALAVVGDGSANVSDPVYAKDGFSAVAPPGGLKDWSGWLRLPEDKPLGLPIELPDARAVVYGAPFNVTPGLSPEPVIGTRGFDWNTLPARPFPFGLDADDDGFFGICVASAATGRIQNNHSATIHGILGSYDPLALPLELGCEGFSDNGQPVSTGLLRRAIDLLSPQPAYAAALAIKRTGGTPGGVSHHFVVGPTGVQVTVRTIADGRVGQALNSPNGVKVDVATVLPNGDPGVPLQLAEVTIELAGNNGLPANFTGVKTVLTDEFGVATFLDLKLFSAGGYTTRVFTTGGLAGLPDAEDFSNAFHIKNRR